MLSCIFAVYVKGQVLYVAGRLYNLEEGSTGFELVDAALEFLFIAQQFLEEIHWVDWVL